VWGWLYFGVPRRRLSLTPRFQRLELVPLVEISARDVLFNFAYYVPFGVIATRFGFGPRASIAMAATFSLLTELSQLFSRSRHPSVTDLLINTLGATAGVALMHWVARRTQTLTAPR
jgi:glycopeptide antibiotics resistance protein